MFLTLWSASVFLTYPHCERDGKSIAWCEFIAVLVGSADVLLTVFVVLLFVRARGGAKCLDACFKVKSRARAVSLSVGQGITDLLDRMQGPGAVRARRQTRIRRGTVDDGTEQVNIHRRTFDAQNSCNIDNPFRANPLGTNGTDVQGANPMVELVDRLNILKKVKAVKRRSFERYHTDDGEEFFVEVGTDESVWDLPSDGKVAFYAVPPLLRVFDTCWIVAYQMQRLMEKRKA